MNAITFLIFLCLNLIATALLAKNDWQSSKEIREYLKEHYPFIEMALVAHTYEQLQTFEPRLFVGEKIDSKYVSATSFSKGILVAARWKISLFEWPAFDFSFSDLSFAQFAHADLRESNLFHVKAHRANFKFAKFDCKKIIGADFFKANLVGARILFKGNKVAATRESLSRCGALAEGALFNGDSPGKPIFNKTGWRCHWFPMVEPSSNNQHDDLINLNRRDISAHLPSEITSRDKHYSWSNEGDDLTDDKPKPESWWRHVEKSWKPEASLIFPPAKKFAKPQQN